MQIIVDPNPVVRNDSAIQVKSARFENFKDRFLAFNDQFSIEEKEQPANHQGVDSAAPLFSNQTISLPKINNANCPQQKNKRRQKQR